MNIENNCACYRKVSGGSEGQREQEREVLRACERSGVSLNIFSNWSMQSCTVKRRSHRRKLASVGREDVFRDFSFHCLKPGGCTSLL